MLPTSPGHRGKGRSDTSGGAADVGGLAVRQRAADGPDQQIRRGVDRRPDRGGVVADSTRDRVER